MPSPRCIFCGKRLISEKSIFRGFGSGCASKLSKGKSPAAKSQNWMDKLERTKNLETGEFVVIGKYIWNRAGDRWSDGKTTISHERFKHWLSYNSFIIDASQINSNLFSIYIRGGIDLLLQCVMSSINDS